MEAGGIEPPGSVWLAWLLTEFKLRGILAFCRTTDGRPGHGRSESANERGLIAENCPQTALKTHHETKKSVEESYINGTRELPVRARVKSPIKAFAEFTEKGRIESLPLRFFRQAVCKLLKLTDLQEFLDS